MNTQNILKFYGSKLDLILDNSEIYDFTLDSPLNIDVILDYSEFFDFELEKLHYKDNNLNIDVILDYSEFFDFELSVEDEIYGVDIPILFVTPIIESEISLCNYSISSQDSLIILTQDGICLQYDY